MLRHMILSYNQNYDRRKQIIHLRNSYGYIGYETTKIEWANTHDVEAYRYGAPSSNDFYFDFANILIIFLQ